MAPLLADTADPFSGIGINASWMLWIVPTALAALVAGYLFWHHRHFAYDSRGYRAGAAVAAVIAIASLVKFVHEADQAMSALPFGATGLLIVVVVIGLLVVSQHSSARRW